MLQEGRGVPQRDIYHDVARNALRKDGWTITHDPLPLSYGLHNLYVDLGAEMPIAAEKEGRRIAVEIKSFRGLSQMVELERALGQFVFYRFLLAEEDPGRALYLAVPGETFVTLFEDAPGQRLIASQALRLVVFHVAREEIIEWIE
jgi:XisH protein